MISINTIVLILWLHFIADFVLQSDWMAINKSRTYEEDTNVGLYALFSHAAVYFIPFMLIGFKFAILNGMIHLIVDLFSSGLTSYLWLKQKRHWFFVTIGFDQAIHMTTLFLTYQMLF